MPSRSALVSGAGIAGQALAHLLAREGYEVTAVERRAAPPRSGYAVDVRGEAMVVLEDLGILDELRGHDTRMRGTTLVDDEGRVIGELPTERFSGDLEVPKAALADLLHRLSAAHATYLFDDHVTRIAADETGVAVRFARAAPRRFDLVVGADGLRSGVRRSHFGDDRLTVRHIGMSGIGFTTDNHLGLDRRGLLQAGRGTAVYLTSARDRARMTVSLSFATPDARLDRRPRREQEDAVRTAFAGHGWEAPRLLRAMAAADELYFASASQVELASWSSGRVVLVGDAAHCAAPTSGMGTSQALVGAAGLARALAETGHDHRRAFPLYEERLRPQVLENQALGRAAAAELGGAA